MYRTFFFLEWTWGRNRGYLHISSIAKACGLHHWNFKYKWLLGPFIHPLQLLSLTVLTPFFEKMEIIWRVMPLVQLKLNFILDHWGLWDTPVINASFCWALKRRKSDNSFSGYDSFSCKESLENIFSTTSKAIFFPLTVWFFSFFLSILFFLMEPVKLLLFK